MAGKRGLRFEVLSISALYNASGYACPVISHRRMISGIGTPIR